MGWKEAFIWLIRVLITLETGQGCLPGWIDEKGGEHRDLEEERDAHVHTLVPKKNCIHNKLSAFILFSF